MNEKNKIEELKAEFMEIVARLNASRSDLEILLAEPPPDYVTGAERVAKQLWTPACPASERVLVQGLLDPQRDPEAITSQDLLRVPNRCHRRGELLKAVARDNERAAEIRGLLGIPNGMCFAQWMASQRLA